MTRQYSEVVMRRVLLEAVEEKGEPGMCDSAKDILGEGIDEKGYTKSARKMYFK